MKFKLLIIILFTIWDAFSQCTSNAGPDTSVCIGSTIQLGAIPAGAGPGTLSYSWSPATGLSCTNCANPTLTVSTNQTYTLTVSSSAGCSATNSVQVTALAVPTASFSINGNNNCSNIPISFTNTSTGTGLSYSWNFGDPGSGANTSTATNPNHTFSATGTGSINYTVTLIVTNSNGCSASANSTVTTLAVPGPSLIDPIADMRNCDGSNFAITLYDASATTAISNYTIQWGDGSPNYSSSTFPGSGVNHTYTTAEIFSVNYILTGTNGCIDTTHYNIANITNPAIGAANPGATTGCGPLTLCFPLNNYSANHSTTYYVVDYGDGSPKDTLPHPPPTTICHTYTQSSCGQAGNQYVFKIKAINMCDSSSASISPIRVYTGPQAHFNPAAVNNCVNTPVTFNNTSVAGFNSSCSSTTVYNWDFGDGQTLTTFTLTHPAHTYTAPGNYTVSLTTTNACGSTTESHPVCIEIPPVPAFSLNPDTACVPFVSIISNTSSLLNTCNVTRTWSVLFNGSSCVPGTSGFNFTNSTSASSLNPEIQFTNAGTYTVQLALTNSCGTVTTTQPIVAQTIPQVTINPLGPICANTSVTPVGNVNSCLEAVDSYNWTFTSGTPANSTLLAPGAVLYTTSGTFPISFSATNLCGTGTANTTILVNPIPPALNPLVNTPICEGDTAQFTSTFQTGVVYSWSGPNGFTSNLQNFNLNAVTTAQAGTYSLFGSIGGCAGPSSSVNLVINAAPVVTVIPATPTICAGSNVSLTANGATTYTWSPATGLSATTGSTVSANPGTTQLYTVSGTTGSCTGSTQITVNVNPLPPVSAGPDTTVCNQPVPFQLGASPAGGTWSGLNVTTTGLFTPNGNGTFTLTYSFTDAFGCQNTDTRIVTVISPTQPNAGIDFSICLNEPDTLLVPTPSGGTWTGSSVTGAGQFTPNSVGLNTVVYHYGTGTCSLTDTLLITVNPLPIVDAGPNFAICIDAGIQTLNGTPSTGTWTGIGITNPTGQFTPTAAGTGTFVLTYTYTDALSCSNSDNLTVLVNPLPVVNAGPDSIACNQPLPFQLGASPAGGTWSGPNVSATGLFTPNGTGSFTLTYTFTDANGCTAFDSRILTINNPTTANAGPDFAICVGSPAITLNPTPTGGTWMGTSTTPAGVFTPNTVGSYNLIYQIGSGACFSSDTLVALVNPLPVVNAGLDQNACISAPPVNLSGTPVGGTWSGTGITNSSGIFSPSTAGVGTHTITYSYTNANGCTNSDQLLFTINALPLVNAGADTTLCNQPFPVQFNATPSGGTWSGPNISAGGSFTPLTVGSFTVTYTFSNGAGCTNSDSRIITVVNPIASNAGPDLSACIDAPDVQLNGTPVSGTWSGSFVSSSGLFNPTVSGTFALVLSNGSGNCLTRDTMLFTVNPLPVVNAGANASFCPNDVAVNFSGSPIGGTWSGVGITNTSTGTFDPGIAGVGSHAIVYTFTNSSTGCLNRDTLLAIVHPFPIAQFTYNPVACLGSPETFTNSSSLATNYQWDFGDGTASVVASPSHTFTNPGFYTVEVLAISAFGCLDSISHTLEVQVPPIANFTLAPDSACGPLTVNFTDLSSGPSLTYNWNYGNGQVSTSSTPVTQIYPAGILADSIYTVTLTLSNFCGSDVHSEPIQVMPAPTAIFGTNTDIGCSPLNLDFVNNSIGLPDSYAWDFGDGSTSTSGASTFQHVFTTGVSDTTYTIQLIVTNECGSDTITHTITVLPNQVNAFFNVDNPSGCVPHTVNFTQFSQGANFSAWDFGDGNGATTYNATHTFTQPGTYTVSLFANDGCGYDTTTATITVFPSPVVDFSSSPDSVCINTLFTFTNLSTNVASVSWDFGDGSNSILFNPQHAYSSSGIFQVTLSGVSQTNGCIGSITKPIVVSVNPVAAFTPSPNAGCENLFVAFNNQSVNTTFQAWDFGDGNFSTSISPTHIYTQAGNYTVKLYVENANGCSDSIEQIITVYPLPIAAFTSIIDNPCVQPATATFSNSSSGAMNYEWAFGNGQLSSLTNPTTSYLSAGNYTVSLIATSVQGCKDTAYQILTIYNQANATFTLPDDSLCVGESAQFVASNQFADSLHWDFGNGSILTGNPVNYYFSASGNYPVTLIAYGQGGCNDTATINTPIIIVPSPIADFTYVNVQAPDPLSGIVEFTNLSSGQIWNYWSFGNGDTSTLLHPIERYESFGEFLTTLIVGNQYGCTDTAYALVNVDFFYGLHIPNAMYPGHSNFQVANFIPKGVGLKSFELLIYDDWGNLIWSTTALDADGRPTEYWDGTFNGVPVQQDAYVWKCTATFMNEQVWEGKEYANGKLKRSGTVTVIR